MRRILLTIAASLTLAGCGASDTDKIEAALKAHERAIDEAKEALEASDVRPPDGFGVSEAAYLIELPSGVADIQVNGDTAAARYANGVVQRLRKVDGKWRVDGR